MFRKYIVNKLLRVLVFFQIKLIVTCYSCLIFFFQVRFAASCALMSFLLENVDNNQYIRKFSDLLPLMLKVSFEIIAVFKN